MKIRESAKIRYKYPCKSVSSGFTLIEILIVVAVIAVITILALLMINPTNQRKKLFDSQRKRDLQAFAGLAEDYNTSYQTYPRGEDICYDEPVRDGNICSCHFCGLSKDSGIFSPLVHKLYCDPEHPRVDYVYQYDCSSDKPYWYKIYAKMTFDTPVGPNCNYGKTSATQYSIEPYPNTCSTETGGPIIPTLPGGGTPPPPGGPTNPPGPTTPPTGGPGPTNTPSPTSPPAPTNTPIPTPTPVPSYPPCPADPISKYCILGTICNICGTTAQCLQPSRCNVPLLYLYSNSSCTLPCQP